MIIKVFTDQFLLSVMLPMIVHNVHKVLAHNLPELQAELASLRSTALCTCTLCRLLVLSSDNLELGTQLQDYTKRLHTISTLAGFESGIAEQ